MSTRMARLYGDRIVPGKWGHLLSPLKMPNAALEGQDRNRKFMPPSTSQVPRILVGKDGRNIKINLSYFCHWMLALYIYSSVV